VAQSAQANDAACLKCHGHLTDKKPVVHAAVEMGCAICHAQLDTGSVPHQSKGKAAKGLAAEGSALCIKCHEKKLFEGKIMHAPVTGGQCLGCHNAHASEHQGLLVKEPAALCLDCHPDIKKGPHVISGFSQRGHPLGNEKKVAQDPLRPGKKFYCAACHEPHRADQPKLNRFGKGMTSCQNCHKL